MRWDVSGCKGAQAKAAVPTCTQGVFSFAGVRTYLPLCNFIATGGTFLQKLPYLPSSHLCMNPRLHAVSCHQECRVRQARSEHQAVPYYVQRRYFSRFSVCDFCFYLLASACLSYIVYVSYVISSNTRSVLQSVRYAWTIWLLQCFWVWMPEF